MNDKLGYGIDLWETNTEMFSSRNDFTNSLIRTLNFSLIKWDYLDVVKTDNKIEVFYQGNAFKLQPGDLIYRNGHVEFYIGNNKVIGWGRLHNKYTLEKVFYPDVDGYHSNDSLDKNSPYTTIIQFKRRKSDVK